MQSHASENSSLIISPLAASRLWSNLVALTLPEVLIFLEALCFSDIAFLWVGGVGVKDVVINLAVFLTKAGKQWRGGNGSVPV
jgi:hypothetical protein